MDPKDMAAAIVGGPSDAPPPPGAGGDEAPMPGGGGDADDMGLQSAAGDLMAAITSKDAAGVASALRAAFEMIQAAPPEEAAEPEA